MVWNFWSLNTVNCAKPKHYKVFCGAGAATSHLKEKHGIRRVQPQKEVLCTIPNVPLLEQKGPVVERPAALEEFGRVNWRLYNGL